MPTQNYLIDGSDRMIFRAEDTVPMFWVGLLDPQTVRDVRAEWEAYDRRDAELAARGMSADDRFDRLEIEWEARLDFVISRQQFERSAPRLLDFVRQNLPRHRALAQDFVDYLDTRYTGGNEVLRVFLGEASAFFPDTATFFDTLEAWSECIAREGAADFVDDVIEQANHHLPDSATGFNQEEDPSDFAGFSETFRRAYGGARAPRPMLSFPTGLVGLPAQKTGWRRWVWPVVAIAVLIGVVTAVIGVNNAIRQDRREVSIAQLDRDLIPNISATVGETRVDLFTYMVDNEISSVASPTELRVVRETSMNQKRILEVVIRGVDTPEVAERFSWVDLGLEMTAEQPENMHEFTREIRFTLGDRGLAYRFEQDGVIGDILFFSEKPMTATDRFEFNGIIQSLKVGTS